MGPRRRTGLRWRRLLGCGLPSGTPGMALCCNLDWEMEPGGSDGKAASASCTFCIPAMAALGGRPFLGRRSLLYAGARRLSSVAVWPGGSVGSRAAFWVAGGAQLAAKASATNHLPGPSGRATTRRGRFPESSGGVVAARDASRRLLVFASALHAPSLARLVLLCFLLAVLCQ